MALFRRGQQTDAVDQESAPVMNDSPAPVEGVPPWARRSLLQWLAPILGAVQRSDRLAGTRSTDFLTLAERRLHIALDWRDDENSAFNHLLGRMGADEEFFLRVLAIAIEHVDYGYSFQEQREALQQLADTLTDAGMAWRLDIQQVATGESWHGQPMYRDVRTLQRRTSHEAVVAVHGIAQYAPDPGKHLGSAWNYAFGRNPDPGHAYGEAIKAVEAAAVPVVLPNDPAATLGKVIGQLRSTPHKWQLALTRDVPGSAGNSVPAIEVVTNMAALLWGNQTDRHAPIQPIKQVQAEMAVHLALTLVQIFTRSATPAP